VKSQTSSDNHERTQREHHQKRAKNQVNPTASRALSPRKNYQAEGGSHSYDSSKNLERQTDKQEATKTIIWCGIPVSNNVRVPETKDGDCHS